MSYRAGDDASKLSQPSGQPEVWIAFDRRTGARLGVVVSDSLGAAREKAAELYAVPFEVCHVVRRSL